MKCPVCNTPVNGDYEYCPNCGSALPKYNTQNFSAPNGGYTDVPVMPSAHPDENKKTKKVAILAVSIVAVVIAAAIAVIAFTLNSSEKYEITDYIADNIDYQGTEGMASVSSEKSDIVNFEAMYNDLSEIDSQSDESKFQKGCDIFNAAIDVEIPENKQLKNGDKVQITIRINYDIINDSDLFDAKLTGDDTISRTYIVSALSDLREINPFSIIKSVKFKESTGKTVISYDKKYSEKFGKYTAAYSHSDKVFLEITDADGNIVEQITFSSSYSNDSDKTATVIANLKNGEENNKENGFVITPVKKEYTVQVVTTTTTTTKPTTKKDSRTDFITDQSQIDYNDYLILKERCLEKRRQKYPDATFARSYFVFNQNYYEKNMSSTNKVNGINFVFYCTDSKGNTILASCCAFNVRYDKYTGDIIDLYGAELTLGKSKYNDFDEYISKIQPGNWDYVETYEY